MMDYRSMVETENSIYHYGVKGMRWGVRRYQNYDGSYTQEGVRRFKKASDEYDVHNNEYHRLKNEKADKSAIREARSKRRAAKREMIKKYKGLKKDKLADKGRNLYEQGETIGGNANKAKYWAAGATALSAASYITYMLASEGGRSITQARNLVRASNVAAIASTAAVLGTIAQVTVNEVKNRQLRAYYAHRQA